MTRYDLCSPRKDRDGKTRWQKVGVMFPAKQGDGFSLKFDSYPLPDEKGEVWVSAFVPKPKDSPAKIDHFPDDDLGSPF